MNQISIFSLIKTKCGRGKYEILSSKKGIIAKIRLYWFILIAIIKDWNLPAEDYPKDSKS
tara:strand:- start:307 stop:486 length:180 start_codon:yes stop_codon:yes gene_type:complete